MDYSWSTTVQSRDEDDFVTVLQLVFQLAFEFPVGRIDQDEDAGSSTIS